MTVFYILIGLVIGGGIIWIILRTANKHGSQPPNIQGFFDTFETRNTRNLKEEMSLNREETAKLGKGLREEVAGLFKGFGDSIDKRISEIRQSVQTSLTSMQSDNSEKLEKMRATVDEKLHATLEKRFGESFKVVSDRLEAVHKGLGEMQTIALGVGDLKKILSNVKSRGTWGEAQLENLLEEILTREQYEKHVKTKKSSNGNVEFAIKLPGGEDLKHIWLPIDAKFPIEDYQRLVEAQEKGDLAAVEESTHALEMRVKSEAKDIRDKYLDPPNTTDFGIMFVPTESLYAEILRRPGLFEQLRRDYKVIVTGPTTIQAILNSLQMGFRTLSIQKRSSEVWALLSGVKTEFGKFGDLLEKTHKKMQEASNTIESAVTKTRTIEKKLNRVEGLPEPEVPKLVMEPLALEKPDLENE